jgi:hypothetical protein
LCLKKVSDIYSALFYIVRPKGPQLIKLKDGMKF